MGYNQRKALEWIKENIKGFGGDPDKVTIWGESAGAGSVAYQMLTYGGDNSGLFRGAIVASGTAFLGRLASMAYSQALYDTITNAASCHSSSDSLQYLRNC